MPGFLAAVSVQLLSVRQEILSDRKNILSTMLTDFPVWMLWTYFHLGVGQFSHGTYTQCKHLQERLKEMQSLETHDFYCTCNYLCLNNKNTLLEFGTKLLYTNY